MCRQDFGFLEKRARIRPAFQIDLPTSHQQKEENQDRRYCRARFLLPHAKGKLVSKRRASLLPRQEKSINIQRRLNIFQGHRAELNELAGKFVVDLIVDLLTQANSTRLGQRLDPGGNIHTITKNVVLPIHDVTHMKADANLDLDALARRRRIVVFSLFLCQPGHPINSRPCLVKLRYGSVIMVQ